VSKFAFHLPLNSTSLGQVSFSILRELYSKKQDILLFPIGGIDASSQIQNEDFFKWIQNAIISAPKEHNRKNPIFKLWHINGSLESFSDKQVLLTFYEVDSPTETEINTIKNNALVLLSSNYAVSVYNNFGVNNVKFLPLGFDNIHFTKKENLPKKDGIYFGLFGKLEPQRKRHLKVLQAWIKKYGNKKGYFLNCAIFNPFLDPNHQSQILNSALNGQKYWNINFLPFLQTNESYNDLLNNTDIVLAMSGGEGWGLPEFQSVALGKYCVGLKAHAYNDWMNDKNSILINPSGKIPVYDNMFFKQGADFNQGNIFDWNEDEFINGMEKAEIEFLKNPININGLELQKDFNYTKIVDNILDILKNI
jgi:hypothetical protein